MAEVLSQSQIDALLNAALSGEPEPEKTDNEAEKKWRKYDFHSPRKFTKDRIKMLNGVFDSYARIINSRINGLLRANCELEIESIEEQRYYEFSNALTEGDVLTLAYVREDEQRGKRISDDAPILFYVSRQIMLSMIDRMIGGEGDPDDNLPVDYAYTELELKLSETIMQMLVSSMGAGWENYINLNFDYGKIEVNPTLVQPLGLEETVVIVSIDMKFENCDGRMSICLPGMTLTNIFAEISRENPGRRGNSEDNSDEIFASLRDSELEMVAELGRIRLQLSDVFHLNVGDVIDTNRSKDSPVYINIDGRRWFDGKMGVHKKNMAIKIGNTYYKPRERDEVEDGN